MTNFESAEKAFRNGTSYKSSDYLVIVQQVQNTDYIGLYCYGHLTICRHIRDHSGTIIFDSAGSDNPVAKKILENFGIRYSATEEGCTTIWNGEKFIPVYYGNKPYQYNPRKRLFRKARFPYQVNGSVKIKPTIENIFEWNKRKMLESLKM